MRTTGDILFALVCLLFLSFIFLVGLLGLIYWTKIDLGIDLFNGHFGDFLNHL